MIFHIFSAILFAQELNKAEGCVKAFHSYWQHLLSNFVVVVLAWK